MKNRNSKQFLIIFSVILVVLIGLHFMAFSFIRSTGLEVSTLENNVTQLRSEVIEFTKYKPDEIRALAQNVSNHFISRDNVVTFIEDIEREAKSRGLEVVIRSADTEPRSEDEADPIERVRLKFETRGSWATTMRFVSYLEHTPYKISLAGIDLSTFNEEGKKSSQNWKGAFEVTALKFK